MLYHKTTKDTDLCKILTGFFFLHTKQQHTALDCIVISSTHTCDTVWVLHRSRSFIPWSGAECHQQTVKICENWWWSVSLVCIFPDLLNLQYNGNPVDTNVWIIDVWCVNYEFSFQDKLSKWHEITVSVSVSVRHRTQMTGDENGVGGRVRFSSLLVGGDRRFLQFRLWRQEWSLGLQCCRPSDSTLQQFWYDEEGVSLFVHVGLSCRVWFPGFCYSWLYWFGVGMYGVVHITAECVWLLMISGPLQTLCFVLTLDLVQWFSWTPLEVKQCGKQ